MIEIVAIALLINSDEAELAVPLTLHVSIEHCDVTISSASNAQVTKSRNKLSQLLPN